MVLYQPIQPYPGATAVDRDVRLYTRRLQSVDRYREQLQTGTVDCVHQQTVVSRQIQGTGVDRDSRLYTSRLQSPDRYREQEQTGTVDCTGTYTSRLQSADRDREQEQTATVDCTPADCSQQTADLYREHGIGVKVISFL